MIFAGHGTPVSESTINQAEANLSSEDLLRLAERHRPYAEWAFAAARRKTVGISPLKNASNPLIGFPFVFPLVHPAVPTGEDSRRARELTRVISARSLLSSTSRRMIWLRKETGSQILKKLIAR
jgi:hypothetical protein